MIKLIVGAADFKQDGWVSTDKSTLDITNPLHWVPMARQGINSILCEHVLEHLSIEQVRTSLSLMYLSLEYGGVLRLAVPDWNNPDPEYQRIINMPEHITRFTRYIVERELTDIGFRVNVLEWFDNEKAFHYVHYSDCFGYIQRSYTHDERNVGGKLFITSVIVDAIKD